MKAEMTHDARATSSTTITWTTLGEYPRVRSYGRASRPTSRRSSAPTTVRQKCVGLRRPGRRRPTELDADAGRWSATPWRDGALGVGSSLIYAPGMLRHHRGADRAGAGRRPSTAGCTSRHIRSEGDRSSRRWTSCSTIARRAGVPRRDLPPQGRRPGQLGQARRGDPADRGRPGRRATRSPRTCTPTPPAPPASTRSMPAWVQAGGSRRLDAAAAGSRPAAPAAGRVARRPTGSASSGPAGRRTCCSSAFKNDSLKPLTGKTLAEVAAARGKTPEETAMDLVVEDDSRVGLHLLPMSEDNLAQGVAAAVGELRVRRGLATRRRGCSSSRIRTRAPTAPSPDCSGATSATRRSSRWRRRFAGSPRCRRRI